MLQPPSSESWGTRFFSTWRKAWLPLPATTEQRLPTQAFLDRIRLGMCVHKCVCVCVHICSQGKEREECVNCSVSTCQAAKGKFLRSHDQQGIWGLSCFSQYNKTTSASWSLQPSCVPWSLDVSHHWRLHNTFSWHCIPFDMSGDRDS